MKIKNIRQYRSFYKNKIRDLPSRDEHFMGTFYRDGDNAKIRGWFEIYHGDKEGYGKAKEGIGNFLSSFLDMAKDGQAVYEFLQNAVDAGASHFTMAWGKDEVDGNHYVLVANNGKMFDFDSIRSILNVGSSTKTDDSKNIGKFGIGFKLAHRLVGKENGLEELLSNNPSGPILFSWGNGELKQLAAGGEPEPADVLIKENESGEFFITDTHPWLFKILITCFPALLENRVVQEEVRLTNGQQANQPVFSRDEYRSLARWVNKYRDILNAELYRQGSLFFIKLGLGKENDLADKNLAEGVRFSLAILQETADEEVKQKQTLQTVQLNREEPIEKPQLQYLLFYITKQDDLGDYLYVRFGVREREQLTNEQKSKIEKEEDIEVLFGFREYDKMDDYFKGAPNFYLYFPLSEEVHNFNFVLHSNAFYKASSRTFLHKGTVGEDGINERLLRTIAKRLYRELLALYESEDPSSKEKFLHLYATLLTSKESQNYDRQWVKKPFIDEITKELKKLVPVRNNFSLNDFELTDLHPFIKATAVEVPPHIPGSDRVKWFYWGADSPIQIRISAIEKLELKKFDIFQLLIIKDVFAHVNKWIEEDRTRVKTILNELNLFNAEKAKSDHFKHNLKNLKLFEFSDGSLLSDNELVEKQDEGYIVLHNRLKNIEPELKKIGIKTSRINLDDFEFYQHYSPYLSPDSQLRSQPKLIELVSNSQPEKLNPSEKNKVFNLFKDMIDEGKKMERLNELRLFKNRNGQCVKIKHLLQKTEHDWLAPYTIHTDEQSKELDRYLLNDDQLIYEQVIYHFWEEIADQIATKSKEDSNPIFDQISNYYKLSEYHNDSGLRLTDKGGLFFNRAFQIVAKPYYHENLTQPNQETYLTIQQVLNEKFDCQVPDFEYLHIYKTEPFILETGNDILSENKYTLSLEQSMALLRFCKVCEIALLDTYTLYAEEGNRFTLIRDDVDNYYSPNRFLNDYIAKYNSDAFTKLPDEFVDFSEIVPLSGKKLTSKLIEELDKENQEQTVDLMEATLQEDEHTLAQLFNALDNLELDLTWESERRNTVVISAVKKLSAGGMVKTDEVQNKLVFLDNTSSIALSTIDSANDDVIVKNKEKEIKLSRALILGLDDSSAIRKILDFAKEAVLRELVTEKEASHIFRIHSASVTPELISNFEENLDDGNLINAHQLAFVLLEESLDRNNLARFTVKDAENNWQRLAGNWILPGISPKELYNSAYVLSNCYEDINSFLKLREYETFYYGNTESEDANDLENIILPTFLFLNGCTPSVLNSGPDKLGIIKYLLTRWKLTPKESRKPILSQTWKDVLGFEPNEKIYAKHILPDEKIDDVILNWVKESEEERMPVLEAIGVHSKSSNIAKLRSWAVTVEDDTNPPVIIAQISPEMLSNTLLGLAEGFVGSQQQVVFKMNSRKHKVIVEIISKLIDAEEEIRIPVWKNDGKLCLGIEKVHFPKYLNEKNYANFFPANDACISTTLTNVIQIIVQDEAYIDYAKDCYELQEIKYDFVYPEDPIEHDEPFYKSWSHEHAIKLFRTSEIEYMAYAVGIEDDKNIYLGKLSFGDFYLEKRAGNTTIYYRTGLSLDALRESLEEEDADIAELLEELIHERDKMLAAFYNALTSNGKDGFDQEDSQRLLEKLKESSLEKEREDLIKEMNSNHRYSYHWFFTYLKYLLSFEELERTITQKSISFQNIETFELNGKISEKYFILKGANSVIPDSIEAFEDFNINIAFRHDARENIKVEGVSKKGQDLLTYIPKGIDESIRNRFSQAVSITINFTPVLDLINRLYSAFTNDAIITPWENIEEALQAIHFIYGPPGTGKTTKLCNLLKTKYEERPSFKALILVPTNKAGDVLAKKLLLDNTEISIVRIGNATDPELEFLDETIYQSSLDEHAFNSANVIITTIHRLPYYKISKEFGDSFHLFDPGVNWDLVIFDESSMIGLPHFVFALLSLKAKNPDTKYIVAGDPKQIPPIIDTSDKNLENIDINDESIYKMLNLNSFEESEQQQTKREKDTIENLKTQFRSIEVIGSLYSQFSYNNLLEHGRDFTKQPVKKLPQRFFDKLKKHVALINIPIDTETSVLQPRKLNGSSYHVYAGILVSEIIKHLDDSCNDELFSVGIISPYKAQAMLMNKLIISSGISKSLEIHCDTVHGFQGDECDIIVFVVNPNNYYYTGHKNALLSKKYVYNVAISRARDYLWVVSPFDKINNPHLEDIQSCLGNNTSVISSSYFENLLFKNEDFIVKNSYLTGHDSINVFGQVDMKYFIKAGQTAIDIQLRK